MAAIVLDGISKVFADGTNAVSDLDLTVEDAEFMVLVGPSGCGKTTALRMVAGLEDISSGKVMIGDRVVNDVAPKDRDVAMVFQNYALYPHLTVADNIGFGLRVRKVDKAIIDERVADAARILGLEDLLDRKPRNLSGGQRQRVAMGRAIVREPRAFLMDEPLSNLDAKLRVQMRSEIARIQRDLKVTTIYVTHDQVEAMTMGDRVAVIRRGRLQQVAPPQDLYDHPINLFVGGFIGSPAMNLIEAALEERDGDLWADFGSRSLRVTDEMVSRRPALRGYVGRRLILGIRPEDMNDAALTGAQDSGRRLPLVVDLAEEMGSEIVVHFEVDAPPVLTEDTRELAGDAGLVALEKLERGAKQARAPMVARFGPRTKAREGDHVEASVDLAHLHFFDVETGRSIWDDVQDKERRE